MVSKKSVLIVDDHPLIREGLKKILESHSDLVVIAEAQSGREGIRLFEKYKPDVVLMDLSLPDINGIEVTRKILECHPETRVMVLSVYSQIDQVEAAFRAGAVGYITKDAAPESLLIGIETIMMGEYYMSGKMSPTVIETMFKVRKSDSFHMENTALTPRENEILTLLAEGKTVKEIAADLFISPKTVENHRSNIMTKCELHSQYDLIRYAAKIGLIDVNSWK